MAEIVDTNQILCSECQIMYAKTSTYKCKTCESNSTTNTTSDNLNSFLFCDGCILIHCKRDHSVEDSEGREVLICKDHKHLYDKFCLRCDVLMCCKCMNNHLNHQLESTETRAQQIRNEICQQLEKLSQMKEPAASKKEAFAPIVERNTADVNKILQSIDEIFDESKKRVKEKIETAFSKFKESAQKAETVVDSIPEIEQELNALLSLTEQQLLLDWKQLSAKIVDLKSKEESISGLVLNQEKFLMDAKSQDAIEKLTDSALDFLALTIPELTGSEVELTGKNRMEKMKVPASVTGAGKVLQVVINTYAIVFHTEESLHFFNCNMKFNEQTLKLTNEQVIRTRLLNSIAHIWWKDGHIIFRMADGQLYEASFHEGRLVPFSVPGVTSSNLIAPSNSMREWFYIDYAQGVRCIAWTGIDIRKWSIELGYCGNIFCTNDYILIVRQTRSSLDIDFIGTYARYHNKTRLSPYETINNFSSMEKVSTLSDKCLLLWFQRSVAILTRVEGAPSFYEYSCEWRIARVVNFTDNFRRVPIEDIRVYRNETFRFTFLRAVEIYAPEEDNPNNPDQKSALIWLHRYTIVYN